MPYRGKPSAGCATCRRRKIKCDLRSGGCEKCEKSGWKCDGYRDIASLLFHDESEKIQIKVRAKASQPRKRSSPKVSPPPPPPPPPPTTAAAVACTTIAPRASIHQSIESKSGSSSDYADSDSTNSITPPPIFDLSPNLDDLAVGFFFDKYVFKYNNGSELWTIDDGNGCLQSSIIALGLAGAYRHSSVGDVDPPPLARKYYSRALQQTNLALRSPKEVLSDSTLQAINILAIYEILSGYERSLDTWRDHIRGASALLQLRGPEQFKTHTGCRLFMQTSANLVIACLSRRIPLPKDVLSMYEEACKSVTQPENTIWRFHCITPRIVDLYSRLLPNNAPPSPELAQGIIIEALQLYNEFTNILDTASDDWKPTVVHETGPLIYGDYYYIFSTSLVVQVFSAICSYRILLIDIMYKALTCGSLYPDFLLSPDQIDQIEQAMGSLKQHQLAILATIPQHFGDRLQATKPTNEGNPSSGTDGLWQNFTSKDYIPFLSAEKRPKDLPFVRLSGGYMIQFPVYTAGAADPPGGEIRSWACGMLRLLGQTIGIRHAFMLANLLDDVRKTGLNP